MLNFFFFFFFWESTIVRWIDSDIHYFFSFFFFLFLTELNRFRVVFSQSQLEQAGQITCNRSHAYYDLCSVDGPTLLESITSTLYALDPINSTQQPVWLKTRPYPRKWTKEQCARSKSWLSPQLHTALDVKSHTIVQP